MKITKLGKGIVQSAGAAACFVLGVAEMALDTLTIDEDCSYGDYDARHSAYDDRRSNGDYLSMHGLDWCVEHAKENFKEAFK